MAIASQQMVAKPRRSRRRPWQQRIDQRRLAQLIPAQGEWTVDDYLWLTRHTNHLIEWVDGWIEELPMPTQTHQRISQNLFTSLRAWLKPRGGVVYYSPLRLRVSDQHMREPDLLALSSAADGRRGNTYWQGADLVVEILSPDNADHDLVTKRGEYAEAAIPEYWIVDPEAEHVTVLTLDGGAYREHGCFGRGLTLSSPLLPDFETTIDEVFAPD